MRLTAALLSFCFASAALAQSDPALVARKAAADLEAAASALDAAESARDRVGALTETIQAYEAGLAALRGGLRAVAIREQAILSSFEAERLRLSRLLAALSAIGAAPAETMLLHPQGALGTARAGILLGEVTPAVEREVRALEVQLEELAALRAVQETSLDDLQKGLSGVQDARTALTQAMADRRDLPMRFSADPSALRRLLDSARSLNAFADGLPLIADGPLPAAPPFSGAKGQLIPPVAGRVLRQFGEADAAGVERPGQIIATRPQALVTAPWPATLRYRGPLLDYGNVVILEPGNDYLLVLTGLGEVYGEIGEVLPQGAPVGLMGGALPDVQAILSEAKDVGGIQLSETLYIELRYEGEPIDPAPWFAETQD